VVAYFTVEAFNWRAAYIIGGVMGLLLLALRVRVFESKMFKNIASGGVSKGNFFAFFTNRRRFWLYLKCIGIGVPTWFVIGILSTFSNEFGKAMGIAEPIKPGLTIMWCYVGLAIGDLCSGFISHRLQSRKKAVVLLMVITIAGSLVYLFGGIKSAYWLYALCLVMGLGIGYWAMFVTIAAEQFGTNLRATAATTVPNMVRGTVVGMTLLYGTLKSTGGAIMAAAVVGFVCFCIGLVSILSVPETHDRDLDFLEH
jgi:MFS family permease